MNGGVEVNGEMERIWDDVAVPEWSNPASVWAVVGQPWKSFESRSVALSCANLHGLRHFYIQITVFPVSTSWAIWIQSTSSYPLSHEWVSEWTACNDQWMLEKLRGNMNDHKREGLWELGMAAVREWMRQVLHLWTPVSWHVILNGTITESNKKVL